jgi:D-alanyl-D-alanine carboxypeptidase/D-alanyl-D-alanine-endopeptidase (penicillin-binding protein 4)
LVKKVLVLPLVVLLLPVSVLERRTSHIALTPVASEPEAAASRALVEFTSAIGARGESLADQGVLIETLDGARSVDEHNADVTFNPASVMKLATSFVALAKLGPDYRYRTNLRAGGAIDWNSRSLEGDLIVQGGSDPIFSSYDADEIALQLSKLGIAHVAGGLRIAGPFYYFATGYHSNLSQETSAAKLRTALQRSGIKIEGPTFFGASEGPLLLSHYSDPLASILLFQNAHSSNAIAEVVGASIGGPRAIQDYLVETVGLVETEIFVGRASGLDFNRITPRATLKVLRALIQLLADHSLRPEDVMPVAGIDSGTLHARLAREDVRGAVVAKTGTLVSLDNGVSTVVGIAYTKAKGPLLFAVFDSGGNVSAYRRLQDQFIEQLIAEAGGALAVARTEDALADVVRHSIVQVLWKPGNQPAETATE